MKNRPLVRLIRVSPFLLCVAAILIVLSHMGKITVQGVLTYIPENPAIAVLEILLLYALKSISIVFPVIVLQIASGHLFAPAVALLVNILGMLIFLALPYGVGHLSGTALVDWLVKKYPKLQKVLELQTDNSFFICFFLRITSCLPSDVVGMYLGATKVPFLPYIAGGSLGVLPGLICATFIGESIRKPSSPMFLFSITLTVLLSAASFLLYYFYTRRSSGKKAVLPKGGLSE